MINIRDLINCDQHLFYLFVIHPLVVCGNQAYTAKSAIIIKLMRPQSVATAKRAKHCNRIINVIISADG